MRTHALVGLLLLVAAVVGVGAFLLVEDATGGFEGMRVHAPTGSGRHPIQTMSAAELGWILATLLLTPVLAASGWLAVRRRRVDRASRWAARRWRIVTAAAACAAGLSAGMVGHAILDRTPITDDEHAYLLHSRIVASGRLTAPSPPGEPFFNNVFVVNNGRWYSQYSLGNPNVLAAGVLAGDPWLVHPLLAVGTVLALAGATRRLYGRRAAVAAAVLAAGSPFLAAVSGTLLAHTPTLFWLAVFLWAGLRAAETGAGRSWCVLAAVAFGAAVLTRPGSALSVGLPLFGLLWQRSRSLEDRWPRWLLFAAAGAAMAGVQAALNWQVNGHPLASGYHVYWLPLEGVRNPFGFGRFPWGIVHTPAIALQNVWHNLLRLDVWLLGWPVSFALPAVTLWLGRGAARWWLLGSLVATVAVNYFFFWPGIPDVGPVLYTETMVALLPLAGAAVTVGGHRWRRAASAMVVAGLAVSVLAVHRVHAPVLARVAADARSAQEFVGERIPSDERALVFAPLHLRPGRQGSWVAGRPNPWPDLRDRVLYVQSILPPADVDFWRRFHPERTAYRLWFEPGAGYRLAPLPPPG